MSRTQVPGQPVVAVGLILLPTNDFDALLFGSVCRGDRVERGDGGGIRGPRRILGHLRYSDLDIEPGPRLVEIIDKRIEAVAAKYADLYPVAMRIPLTDKAGLSAHLRAAFEVAVDGLSGCAGSRRSGRCQGQ